MGVNCHTSPRQGERHRRRESVGEVRQIIGLPVLVTPVAPAAEQNAPAVTVPPGAGAGAGGLPPVQLTPLVWHATVGAASLDESSEAVAVLAETAQG
jgi:hypothetical protein